MVCVVKGHVVTNEEIKSQIEILARFIIAFVTLGHEP